MSGVFRNIDPPTPPPPGECVPPAFGEGGGHTRHSLGGEGVGVKSSEDARHCSVLYICKYFVVCTVEVVLFPPDSSLRSTEVHYIFLPISQNSLCPFNNVPTENIKSHIVYNTVASNLLLG
jgi:hypothetical protein